MSARAELLRTRVQNALRQCRAHRFYKHLSKTDPVAFRASHGYSYRPADALREHQRDLVALRRKRASVSGGVA